MMRNGEGYHDPTAGKAIRNTEAEEREIADLGKKGVKAFRMMMDVAGFDVVGQIVLRCRKNGKEYRR